MKARSPAAAYPRTIDRYELKYILPLEQGRAFLRDAGERLVADAHAGPDGGYRVSSLYYDSPARRCYWEKIEGLRFRRKLRLRRYGEGEQAFVEIKQREDRTVQKRRCRLPSLREAWALLPAPEGAEAAGADELGALADDPVLREARYLADAWQLEPATLITYRREAWLGAHDPGLRLTLDHDLRCRGDDLARLEALDHDPRFLPADQAVLEVKFNTGVPLWLTAQVARFECTLQRISKYCAGVERLQLG